MQIHESDYLQLGLDGAPVQEKTLKGSFFRVTIELSQLAGDKEQSRKAKRVKWALNQERVGVGRFWICIEQKSGSSEAKSPSISASAAASYLEELKSLIPNLESIELININTESRTFDSVPMPEFPSSANINASSSSAVPSDAFASPSTLRSLSALSHTQFQHYMDYFGSAALEILDFHPRNTAEESSFSLTDLVPDIISPSHRHSLHSIRFQGFFGSSFVHSILELGLKHAKQTKSFVAILVWGHANALTSFSGAEHQIGLHGGSENHLVLLINQDGETAAIKIIGEADKSQ
jgi:hypothetical protein